MQCNYAPYSRVIGDIRQLSTVGNRSRSVSSTTSGWTEHRTLAKRNGTVATRLDVPHESILVRSLKLALEKPIELCVLGSLLTIRHGKCIRRVTRLLDKNLRELDHVRVVVELLRQVYHRISLVLLIAWTRSSQKSIERGLRLRVTLVSATSGELI